MPVGNKQIYTLKVCFANTLQYNKQNMFYNNVVFINKSLFLILQT